MGEQAVILEGLAKRFGPTLAVDRVSLEVGAGEFLTLLGSSGSGKTTTLMMIAGFVVPSDGRILFGGENVTYKPSHKRNVGVVFQNYALFPHLTIFDNVAFPLKMRRLGMPEVRERVEAALQLVQLQGLEARYPRQLSGGQQQRVALARALVFQPPLLLMDEPLGALDRQLRQQMQLEIKHIQRALGITVIYVTHDQEEALVMSDRIAVMSTGRILQVGTATEIYQRPADSFVAQFIGESNILAGRIAARDGDICRVEVDGGLEAWARADRAMGVGERAAIAFRPERATLAGGELGGNLWDGVVEEVIYIGEITKYRIQVKDRVIVTVKELNRGGEAPHQVGDRVQVSWPVGDTRLL